MAVQTLLEPRAKAHSRWEAIRDPRTRIVVEEDAVLLPRGDIGQLLDIAPFGYRTSGSPDAVVAGLPPLPASLANAIAELAGRFAALMHCGTVRVRLEGVTGNACRKVHADYTDLRLICTLAGPGTDYTLGDDPDGPLQRIPAGAVALFKGREFGPGHSACLHRSPPIEDTGERRLVLVIDTPARHPAE
ncbi:uncharacterized protein DUF1826 [Blastomonas natatoria]|uniref:Uncharacterized protein DUF1826 n=1 Tax=Blastomonas natatoria TaxID=34015 RepID=A0A2V3VH65_9SPHN|nr:DUF1826 domain-containing protein [Blastomonas natatoria]PXW79385.1 uncharacterized protein DUF1826 [Blastomonas natatoria]